MKPIVIFDSNFGNTKLIANAIAEVLDSEAVLVDEASKYKLSDYNLVIIGSPIIGWKPSEKMGVFLSQIEGDQLSGAKVAAFDTRVKLFIHGDAMEKIAKMLENAGGDLIIEPMPFYVKGQNGPLLDGEVEKAKSWAKEILNKMTKG